MEKAKSRLSSHQEHKLKLHLPKGFDPLMKYWHHLPTLIIGLVFLLPLLGIINWIQPSTVQNWLFPNSYLPFTVLFFLSSFFLSSFVLLHTRRGFFIALVTSALLLLKLQNFQLGLIIVGVIVSIFVILEIFLSLLLRHQDQPDST